jgi:ATP-binding cassette subfamily B protein
MSALQEISKDHTSLIIAHRLSTVVNADKIVVLHQGAMVEQGTHDQLLDKKGRYFDLWTAQLRDQS